MTRTALYRHFDAEGRLIYVGVSANPTRRMWEHRCRTDWAAETVRSETFWYPTRPEALAAEREAIAKEMPLANATRKTDALQEYLAGLVIAERGEGRSFGAWLKARKIKQTEVASVMGEARTFINEVCNGRRSPGLRLAIKIEDFTGGEITVRDLADFYDHAQRRALTETPA
jgi:predicted GIY-YIG superfamily endonuclease/DNA-binding XRE family transcriptional regulator